MRVPNVRTWTDRVLARDLSTRQGILDRIAVNAIHVSRGIGVPVNFEDFDLRGISFAYATVCGGNFRNADLRGVDMSCADVRYADFRGARLAGANLTNARTTGAKFDKISKRGNMEVLESMDTYTVYVSRDDVVTFAENCPGLPAQSVSFVFDKRTHDLVGMRGVTANMFEASYRPLAENARIFAQEKLWLK